MCMSSMRVASSSVGDSREATSYPPGASTVEFHLTAIATGTRLDLCHSNLPDIEVPGHADGWKNFLPRLAIASAVGDAGVDNWIPLSDRTT